MKAKANSLKLPTELVHIAERATENFHLVYFKSKISRGAQMKEAGSL